MCSPETAPALALTGKITDPRDLGIDYPQVSQPLEPIMLTDMLIAPLPADEASRIELAKGTNIGSIPELDIFPEDMELEIMLKVGDNISTDEILLAGAKVLPCRSNLPRISEFVFTMIDDTYSTRAANEEKAARSTINM